MVYYLGITIWPGTNPKRFETLLCTLLSTQLTENDNILYAYEDVVIELKTFNEIKDKNKYKLYNYEFQYDNQNNFNNYNIQIEFICDGMNDMFKHQKNADKLLEIIKYFNELYYTKDFLKEHGTYFNLYGSKYHVSVMCSRNYFLQKHQHDFKMLCDDDDITGGIEVYNEVFNYAKNIMPKLKNKISLIYLGMEFGVYGSWSYIYLPTNDSVWQPINFMSGEDGQFTIINQFCGNIHVFEVDNKCFNKTLYMYINPSNQSNYKDDISNNYDITYYHILYLLSNNSIIGANRLLAANYYKLLNNITYYKNNIDTNYRYIKNICKKTDFKNFINNNMNKLKSDEHNLTIYDIIKYVNEYGCDVDYNNLLNNWDYEINKINLSEYHHTLTIWKHQFDKLDYINKCENLNETIIDIENKIHEIINNKNVEDFSKILEDIIHNINNDDYIISNKENINVCIDELKKQYNELKKQYDILYTLFILNEFVCVDEILNPLDNILEQTKMLIDNLFGLHDINCLKILNKIDKQYYETINDKANNINNFVQNNDYVYECCGRLFYVPNSYNITTLYIVGFKTIYRNITKITKHEYSDNKIFEEYFNVIPFDKIKEVFMDLLKYYSDNKLCSACFESKYKMWRPDSIVEFVNYGIEKISYGYVSNRIRNEDVIKNEGYNIKNIYKKYNEELRESSLTLLKGGYSCDWWLWIVVVVVIIVVTVIIVVVVINKSKIKDKLNKFKR